MAVSNLFRAAAVFAALSAGTTGATAPVEPTVVRGTITRLSAPANTLTVRPTAGADVPLTVGPGARVEVGGKAAGLGQFKEGQRVRVSHTPRGDKNEVVRLQPAVTTDEELGREVKQALGAAKSYTFQQKDKYAADLRETADDVADRIDHLEAEAKVAGAEAKAKIQARIAQLRKQHGTLNDRLSEVSSATADAWDDVKSGAGAAPSDLDRALDELFKK